jgi:hypothetical protein
MDRGETTSEFGASAYKSIGIKGLVDMRRMTSEADGERDRFVLVVCHDHAVQTVGVGNLAALAQAQCRLKCVGWHLVLHLLSVLAALSVALQRLLVRCFMVLTICITADLGSSANF